MGLTAYHTGLVAIDYERFPKFPYRGNGWSLSLKKPPVGATPTYLVNGNRRTLGLPAKEVIIHASSSVQAQKIGKLISCAIVVLDGCAVFSFDDLNVQRVRRTDFEGNRKPGSKPIIRLSPNVPLGCLIAAKASLCVQE